MLRNTLLVGLLVAATLMVSGCYRVPIPQGNIISDQMLSKVSVGMRSAQVTAILGNPVLENTFVNNQTAYVYTYKAGFHPFIVKRIIIYFKNDHVVRVESTDNPKT